MFLTHSFPIHLAVCPPTRHYGGLQEYQRKCFCRKGKTVLKNNDTDVLQADEWTIRITLTKQRTLST